MICCMLKEFEMVWIILLKLFKNIFHVISIHPPPYFFYIEIETEERFHE